MYGTRITPGAMDTIPNGVLLLLILFPLLLPKAPKCRIAITYPCTGLFQALPSTLSAEARDMNGTNIKKEIQVHIVLNCCTVHMSESRQMFSCFFNSETVKMSQYSVCKWLTRVTRPLAHFPRLNPLKF
jgi:hypothetical protein